MMHDTEGGEEDHQKEPPEQNAEGDTATHGIEESRTEEKDDDQRAIAQQKRDHAGVGNFYDPFASQKVFEEYPELDISPIFFPAFFYCRKCLTFTNPKVCPHDAESREQISGTKLRSMIQEGKAPSEFILRPEVAKVIIDFDQPFVD